MKIKYAMFFPVILFAMATMVKAQTASADALKKYSLLFGEWVSDGKPGEGSGFFSFTPDLDNRVIVRKNHVSFPATAGKPAFTHDDLLLLYAEQPGKLDHALYTDNEDHVIHYTVTASEDGRNIVFQSVPKPNMPLFKLLYSFTDAAHVDVSFQIAQPNAPDVFHTYLTGKAHKKN